MTSLSIDFDRLRLDRAGSITVDATKHAVKQMSASLIALIGSASKEQYFETALVVVARLVPTLSEEQRNDLSPDEVEAILSIAQADLEAVRRLDPNYQAPDPNGERATTEQPSPA